MYRVASDVVIAYACVPNKQFVCVLSFYYLVDVGYANCLRFLAPFLGQWYHWSSWADKRCLETPKELFNMKHR